MDALSAAQTSDSGVTANDDRLWTPWRMRYVVDGVRENGCIFCGRLADDRDTDSLILHRGERGYIIMNLFPYNTGHVMIVPNAHIATPEDADPETLTELALLRAPLLRALRRAISPEGFNIGLNVGSVAGAGIAAHLHEHVVPRWLGDANFMPIVASTMVMPELIPVTYAKIRSELARETGNVTSAIGIVVSHERRLVIAEASHALPRVDVVEREPVWRTLLHDVRGRGADDAELVGWATEEHAGTGPIVLMFRSSVAKDLVERGIREWATIDDALEGPDGHILGPALQRSFEIQDPCQSGRQTNF